MLQGNRRQACSALSPGIGHRWVVVQFEPPRHTECANYVACIGPQSQSPLSKSCKMSQDGHPWASGLDRRKHTRDTRYAGTSFMSGSRYFTVPPSVAMCT